MQFEWDPDKAKLNVRKHDGVTFAEAETVFLDRLVVEFPDPDHSDTEHREKIIGLSAKGRILVISFTVRDGIIRIINARAATRRERKGYEDGTYP